jgi:hypothetical protein
MAPGTATITGLTPTLANTDDNSHFGLCWEGSLTLLRIQVRTITPALGVYFAFPGSLAVAVATGGLVAASSVRVGGWSVRDGDRLALTTTATASCGSVAVGSRVAAVFETAQGGCV